MEEDFETITIESVCTNKDGVMEASFGVVYDDAHGSYSACFKGTRYDLKDHTSHIAVLTGGNGEPIFTVSPAFQYYGLPEDSFEVSFQVRFESGAWRLVGAEAWFVFQRDADRFFKALDPKPERTEAQRAKPSIRSKTAVVGQLSYTPIEAATAHHMIEKRRQAGEFNPRAAAAYKAHVSRRTEHM